MKGAEKTLERIREDLRALSAAKRDYDLQYSNKNVIKIKR
jgi:hypothetical protein